MKSFEVIWTKSAEFDLESIIEYIKTDSIETAKKIFFAIKEECNNLYYFPQRKRIVPELQQIGILKYIEVIYQRWRIIYMSSAIQKCTRMQCKSAPLSNTYLLEMSNNPASLFCFSL